MPLFTQQGLVEDNWCTGSTSSGFLLLPHLTVCSSWELSRFLLLSAKVKKKNLLRSSSSTSPCFHLHKSNSDVHLCSPTEGWFLSIIYLKILFIYLTGCERAQARGGAAEGEADSPAEQGAQWKTWSQDPEIMTWAEGRPLTKWATQMSLIKI